MNNSSDEYHISFFKPTTPHATANRNLVVWFVIIWFFAIFGFQILLWAIEKPTPEPAYVTFQKVWPKMESSSASTTELQELGQVTLSVLGKLALSPDDKAALNNVLSWAVYTLTADSDKESLITTIKEFEKLKADITNISDPVYIESKMTLSGKLSPLLKLSTRDIRTKLLPLELTAENMTAISEQTAKTMPGIMKKYLVHNQSFLTDFKFLGFPFHYFYTAVFLLILFVGLCWLYCVKTDSLNKKLGIVD